MMVDEQLISRMAEGDSSALAEFYDQYAPQVLGLLARMLPSRSDAEDVLQEVFWQTWKTADRYDPSRGKPRAWLFMRARSRAIDWLRRRKVTVPISEEHEPTTWKQPTEELQRQESAERIRRLLSELPEEQRQVLLLSYYEGLAHKDIAQHLRIPLGTAKTRIRLGMKRLRDLLTQRNRDRTPLTGRAIQ